MVLRYATLLYIQLVRYVHIIPSALRYRLERSRNPSNRFSSRCTTTRIVGNSYKCWYTTQPHNTHKSVCYKIANCRETLIAHAESNEDCGPADTFIITGDNKTTTKSQHLIRAHHPPATWVNLTAVLEQFVLSNIRLYREEKTRPFKRNIASVPCHT